MSNALPVKSLVISKGVYRRDQGFFVREPGRGGHGVSVFVNTLSAAKLYAIAILEENDGLKRRVFATDGTPEFTLGDYDALIVNAEKRKLIRYRGVK